MAACWIRVLATQLLCTGFSVHVVNAECDIARLVRADTARPEEVAAYFVPAVEEFHKLTEVQAGASGESICAAVRGYLGQSRLGLGEAELRALGLMVVRLHREKADDPDLAEGFRTEVSRVIQSAAQQWVAGLPAEGVPRILLDEVATLVTFATNERLRAITRDRSLLFRNSLSEAELVLFTQVWEQNVPRRLEDPDRPEMYANAIAMREHQVTIVEHAAIQLAHSAVMCWNAVAITPLLKENEMVQVRRVGEVLLLSIREHGAVAPDAPDEPGL